MSFSYLAKMDGYNCTICKFKFYISYFYFLNFYIVKVITIIYGQQNDSNLLIESLNKTFCIILLYLIKIRNWDSYGQMKYMVLWK